MRVAITGTPGTGKTSAVAALEGNEAVDTDAVEVIGLNEHVETDSLCTGFDESRESLVADLDALAEWLDEREHATEHEGEAEGDTRAKADVLLVESHLAHLFAADRVVVLRCRPEELKRRLDERGVTEAKATENAESEALDAVLSEAVARHGLESVYEIDTTDRTPTEVSEQIAAVLAGERAPSAGTVSFLEYFE